MTDFTALAAAAAPAAPVGPGLIGFLVVAAIGVALYFLVKSMNRQISKIEVPHEEDLAKREASERAPGPESASTSGESGAGRGDNGTH
ncbi:hypothetical protein DQ384_11455 [Sphaerisporangium album]|uniref:Uncharacterized protein n=1 Tax=Sphaerisporangium album TaxID=509200 RepID=A0A367FM30_9ACTN|nr:hypothetical protein [Sphaerisporangium album]RCG31324.1 hypothetical protein DQ384_11455 [Sphaerisporangium album]